MPDREKVKKGVWQCWLPSTEEEYATQCHDCPYYEPGITLEKCMTALRTDVLELLKSDETLIENLARAINDLGEKLRSQPQIVRCKDCAFGTPEKNGNGEDCIECSNSLEHLCHSPDWFCGDGYPNGGDHS